MTAISVTRLAPALGARVEGVDITRPVADAVFAEIRAAFEEHSVLVFHDQPFDDETQVAFSRHFGPLEVTLSVNPAAGTPFARQSNLDIKTGEVIPPDDRRMLYQRANMLWHSDSSFKRVPSLCSLLSGRIVPPEGGATEFASTRAGYAALPETTRRRLEDLVVVHDFSWSRDQISPGFFTEAERAPYPPVRHRLVRTNPANGRRALLIGAHASSIEGMPLAEGRALLRELLDHVTRPERCYRHAWRVGDLVVWDNRAVLHRATPYDTTAVPPPHAAHHDLRRPAGRRNAGMRLVDLSMTVEECDSTPFAKEEAYFKPRPIVRWEDKGFVSNMVEMTVHAGTHIDSPHHFFRDKPSVEQLPLDHMIGDAVVLDLTFKGTANARIGPEDLDRAEAALATQGIRIEAGAMLFLRTDWPKGHVTTDPRWWDESPCLTRAAAEWLVAKRPAVLGYDFAQEEKGTDYGTAGEILGSGMRVHRIILPRVVFQIENLINLDQIPSKVKVIALPAKWKTESAPARVVALVEE